VDNLAPRILNLVARLSGQETRALASATPDQATTETAYRQALQRWFELTAQGPSADQAEVARVYQELLRLIDEVGEPRATALRRQWAREWWEESRLCPYCGERGPYHDPRNGGEAIGEGHPPRANK